MTKRLIVLSALMLLTAYQGLVVSDALAADGGFTTMWAIDLPRTTYFIGESVTFTVVAFASIDPTLLLPDQMAKVTIRNGSLVEVFEAWVTTNANGSAPVTWDTGLEAAPGNYTVILDDLKGGKVVAKFDLLYNEETFWQTRVDLLERELQSQYDYINYLFAVQKYQERRMDELGRMALMGFATMFATLFIALWTWFPELAKRARAGKGIYEQLGKGLAAMGITSEPRIYLDHEEVSQISVPADKAAPRFNVENYCEVCDKAHEKPLTLVAMEDHLAIHDRYYLRRPFWRAKRRQRIREKEAKAHEPEKKPELAYGTVKECSDDWEYRQKVGSLKIRVNGLKKLYDKKRINTATFKAEMKKVRAEVERLKEFSSKEPEKSEERKSEPTTQVLKVPSLRKTESPRKVRTERILTGILKAPEKIPAKVVVLDNNPLSIASCLEDHPDSELNQAPKKTAIDELFERLNHEKVN